MPTKTVTHNFSYTVDDIKNLIKADIARQLKRDTIPIINYSIGFRVEAKEDPTDWRAEYPLSHEFAGAQASVEVPG